MTCVCAALVTALASAVIGAPLQQPSAPAKETQEITSALNRYLAAMEAKDLAGVKAVWPALSETQQQKIRISFTLVRSIQVQLQVVDIQVDGSSAVANCRRRDQIVTNEGQRFQTERKTVVRLVQIAGAWSIDSMQ